MTTTASVEPAASQAKAVAAIDIGANGIRMVIAQVFPDGRFEQLEQLQRAVRLGQDTFRRGRLSAESLRAADCPPVVVQPRSVVDDTRPGREASQRHAEHRKAHVEK